MRGLLVKSLILFFVLALYSTVLAGANVTVNSARAALNCAGTLTVRLNYTSDGAASVAYSISAPGLGVNTGGNVNVILGTATASISAPVTISPAVGASIAVSGSIATTPYATTVTVPDCADGLVISHPEVMCDDGRLNPTCDVVAIYAIEDDDGIHMQVWYVLKDDGRVGRFAFMVYADELAQLPENPDSDLLVASSEDGYVNLYWATDNTYRIEAGPDFEGKIRVFVMENFPGGVTAYTQE